MPLVRRMESCGSRSGKTMKPIVVADSGELPSRRQILSRMAAEREENLNYKKDPLQVGHLFLLKDARALALTRQLSSILHYAVLHLYERQHSMVTSTQLHI